MGGRKAFAALLFLWALLGVSTEVRAGESRAASPQSGERVEIEKLIEQLGDDQFEAREQATLRLLALGEKALDALEEGRKSSDLEIRRRSRVIAEEINRSRHRRILRQMLVDVGSIPIDQFIDLMATRKEFDKPENWQRFHQTAEALTLQASQLGDRVRKLPTLDYKRFPTEEASLDSYRPFQQRNVRIDGVNGPVNSFDNCMVVSGDSIPRFTSLVRSILFVNGDLKGGMSITNSFIFCNGNIGRVTCIRNSIILATGDFVGSNGADNSFFQVKSVGGHNCSRGNVYLNLASIRCTSTRNNTFPQSDKGPLQTLKFFDPARQGIEFSQAGEHVRIDKVDAGEAFAAACVRAGDIVLTADNDTIASSGDLRKFLRRRFAGDRFTLRVKRGEKLVEARIKLKD